ncbi:winged helix DNA-binding domain-containing protein [Herbidospora sp. NEAU-GS84]|uniref:Winged helix DNA-binding domain-containing protein n=1 Tax=Herbidospora solisilvae TaxID=2696284 RepID=A0A7C9J2D3_9ACTN|nr:winged helix DNA-binding domain-containing protein [Herbidospora solisilvae]NAS21800.1 winged helix DNA-binding domain-containing protein [Herbidospora solisilvae]
MNDPWPRRAAAQFLDRPRTSVPELVRGLLAVQAQDPKAAALALRARGTGFTRRDVEEAIRTREITRAWGPRGTLHLIRTDDLPWLLSLTRPSTATIARRLAQLGVTGDDLAGRVERATFGQGPLTKAELGERLGAEGQAIVHLAALAAERGRLVLGPDRGGRATYVHAADWLGAPIAFEPDREKALKELGVRYARAHAPATPEDLAYWSGVSLREARRAHHDVPEKEPWHGLRLLPAFDEFLLGWKERAPMTVPTATIVPGGGMIRPAVVKDGMIVGTWSLGANDREIPDGEEIADIANFLHITSK